MMPSLPIVGIGASAGGVEALEQFFKSVPAGNGLAFVVLTHLPPDRESMLSEILGRATRMPVVDARDGDKVEAEHVYVLPPGAILTIRKGHLQLRWAGPTDRERAPIDVFFNSLAEDQAEHAIGIVLSGSGHDGTLGLKAIKEHGGLTIAQGANVTRPRFAEMPSSAVAAGIVDLELPVETISERIIGYVRSWGSFETEPQGDALTTIFNLLRTRTGHDFREYKERTFQRRVQRRMQVVQTTKLDDYAERLQREPDEVSALFRDLLIGVTDFFRDAAAFQAVETLVIPKLFEGKGGDDEVRVWVPGCSTGEEVYSIAILLREHLEKSSSPPKTQVFATDIDEDALVVARAARYPASVVKEVPLERLRRFFVHEAGTYRVVKELRDMCIFSTHSVIRDPPFSRIDLISCRNLLIYLKSGLQAQIIPLFHYALRPSGYLFLGSSENVSRHSELFVAIDRKNRIFRRRDLVARPPLPLQRFLLQTRREAAGSKENHEGQLQRSDSLRRAANAIVEHFAPTFVIVDETGQTLYFSSGTGRYLQPAAGPPNRDIVAMARPGLRADLRTALHRARETGQRVVRDRIPVQINGGIQMVSLAVEPIVEGKEIAYGVVFTDRGLIAAQDETPRAERPEGEDTTVQLIEKMLQETKERLQSTIEELETANEEFRSSNEELLSVNEELQSTNEELETSKEELQSVNEELQTVNNELSSKIEELDRANSDLNNLFQSTQIATIFLDRNLEIRSFTPAVTQLFNLIPSDRGRPLTDIVSRIDYPDLERDMRRVCAGKVVTERTVSHLSGTGYYLARILPYRAPNNQIDGVLLTFVDVTSLVAAEEQQKVLAAELSHRVKNTLAVVSSIAERTLSDGDAKETLIGRLHALGHTHDVLSESGWTEAGLRELISAELSPHTIGDGSLQISGPPVMLKPQAALFIALAVHELSTNAAKYGALSVPAGRVAVSWIITGDQPPRLEIDWQEEGGPKIDGFGEPGFGTELIERGIRFELQGEAKLETVNGGLHCRVVIPANPQNLTFGSPGSRQRVEDAP
jgi:two-component system, chemotaxis family, CheB/CheR fusion protein